MKEYYKELTMAIFLTAEKLLDNDNSITIHEKKLHCLETEMFKLKKTSSFLCLFVIWYESRTAIMI